MRMLDLSSFLKRISINRHITKVAIFNIMLTPRFVCVLAVYGNSMIIIYTLYYMSI